MRRRRLANNDPKVAKRDKECEEDKRNVKYLEMEDRAVCNIRSRKRGRVESAVQGGERRAAPADPSSPRVFEEETHVLDDAVDGLLKLVTDTVFPPPAKPAKPLEVSLDAPLLLMPNETPEQAVATLKQQQRMAHWARLCLID